MATRAIGGGSGEPVGTVLTFPGNTPPRGYLKANGQEVSRTQYKRLYAVIGVKYGSGDGATTFNLPDYRGEFLRGFDDGRGVDTERQQEIGVSQGDQIKSHGHGASTSVAGEHNHTGTTSTNGNHTHTAVYMDGANGAIDGFTDTSANPTQVINTSAAGNHNHSLNINNSGSHYHAVTIENTGGSETRPRNVSVLYCIKYR